MTSPVIGWLSGGPWRHGVAVILIAGWPGRSRMVAEPAARPWALPRSRLAPETVVSTCFARGRNARGPAPTVDSARRDWSGERRQDEVPVDDANERPGRCWLDPARSGPRPYAANEDVHPER
jgi:hypothetical protein